MWGKRIDVGGRGIIKKKSVFSRMTRVNAIVLGRCVNEDQREIVALAQILVGRDLLEKGAFGRDRGRTIFTHPGGAGEHLVVEDLVIFRGRDVAGCWFSITAISKPPLERPEMPSLRGLVIWRVTRSRSTA